MVQVGIGNESLALVDRTNRPIYFCVLVCGRASE
jgi:hypothetical protein